MTETEPTPQPSREELAQAGRILAAALLEGLAQAAEKATISSPSDSMRQGAEALARQLARKAREASLGLQAQLQVAPGQNSGDPEIELFWSEIFCQGPAAPLGSDPLKPS